jgi:hypothetical protein
MNSGMCAPPLNLKSLGKNCAAPWMKAAVRGSCSALLEIKFCSMVCRSAPQPAKKILRSC